MGFSSAAEAQERIDAAREHNPVGPVLSAIGYSRGGSAMYGGILWSDFREEPRAPFRQVHGHTVMPNGPWLRYGVELRSPGGFARLPASASLNLDVGAKGDGDRVVGCWLTDDAYFTIVDYSLDFDPQEER